MHEQCCDLGSKGVLGLNMHTRPGDPARTDQAPTCVQTAGGFLHRLAGRLNGPLFDCCCDAQLGKDLGE